MIIKIKLKFMKINKKIIPYICKEIIKTIIWYIMCLYKKLNYEKEFKSI